MAPYGIVRADGCHSTARVVSYLAMSHHSYLFHREAKRPAARRLELSLLDRDLACAGIQIPWTACVRADDAVRVLVVRVVRDVLRAA